MAGLKWSPGCNCCDAAEYESCFNNAYSLTNGTAFDTTVWEADTPANVSYVSSEVIQVTNTTIRLLSPPTRTAYAVRVTFTASSGTPSVKIRCNDGMGTATAYGTATYATGGGNCEVSVNGGTAVTYCNNVDTAIDGAIQVNFTPDYILSAARAYTDGDELFNSKFYSGHVLIDQSTPTYDENWEIEVTGTVNITEVYYQTATVDYTTSPQTYCDPQELWEDTNFIPYVYVEQYVKENRNRGDGTPYTNVFPTSLVVTGDDLSLGSFDYIRWGGNATVFDDLTTAPSDILKLWNPPGTWRTYRCWVQTNDTSPDSNDRYWYVEAFAIQVNAFTEYIKNNPSNGDEYPVPFWRVTINIDTDCTVLPQPTTSDISLGNVGSQFSISTPSVDYEAFGCASTMYVTWTHG